jgi:hypothetical protein
MSRIDWPLVAILVVVFAVSSVVRWRYFKRRFAKRDRAD